MHKLSAYYSNPLLRTFSSQEAVSQSQTAIVTQPPKEEDIKRREDYGKEFFWQFPRHLPKTSKILILGA
jgi:hypothetical protein